MRALTLSIISIVAAVIAAVAIGTTLLSQPQPTTVTDPPWEIAITGESIRVFGIEIGRDRLEEAQRAVGEEGKITLFIDRDGHHSTELFFERVPIGAITGAIVITAAMPEEEAAEIAGRGLRVSTGPSGARKVTIRPDDATAILASPVATITFIPSVRLEEETIGRRFGEPTMRIRERESGTVHWLYPERGVAIALGGRERSVVSYMRPAEFDRRMAGLHEQGDPLYGPVLE